MQKVPKHDDENENISTLLTIAWVNKERTLRDLDQGNDNVGMEIVSRQLRNAKRFTDHSLSSDI